MGEKWNVWQVVELARGPPDCGALILLQFGRRFLGGMDRRLGSMSICPRPDRYDDLSGEGSWNGILPPNGE